MEVFDAALAGNRVFPWAPLRVMPIGDFQYDGTETTDLARLRKHVQWGVDNGCVFIGMGDYIDFASPSNRARLISAGLFDTARKVIDDAATRLERDVMRVLAPTRGRWLTLVEGHHYYTHEDGTTTGQRLAGYLGTRYGGDAAYMRLTFRDKGSGINTKLFVHHGHGGAGTVGGAITKVERFMARVAAQIVFVGHYHQVLVVPMDTLDITSKGEPTLFHTTRAAVLTGSFMRGWQEGRVLGVRPAGSYVEQHMLPPVALGGPVITLTPVVHRVRGSTVRLVDVRGSV